MMTQADVPLSMAFMKKFVAHSPNGQVFIYSRPSRRTDINEHNLPTGIVFDYSKEWTKTYVESGPANNFNVISRSYVQQFMSAMRDTQHNDAATKNMKPVRLIPAGEAFSTV